MSSARLRKLCAGVRARFFPSPSETQIHAARPHPASPRLRAPHLLAIAIALSLPSPSFATEQSSPLPAWLQAQVGPGDNQIAPVVLQRARALYLRKVHEGTVHNPCYFAMDATRPNDANDTALGRRFYVICEARQSFQMIPAGHGGGRNLPGIANFANGRRCAKNFGNAMDSNLTTGGIYVTAETKSSFKGYYRTAAQRGAIFTRTFLQFDGEGDTANARPRRIGGHAAAALKGICRRKDPASPYADHDGYVPFGNLVDYSGGRSDGCTSWSPSDAPQILAIVSKSPTTLYLYPEAGDIRAVARAVAAGQSLQSAGLYWDASCLKEIHAPRFWPKETLEPILAQYEKDHPPPPVQPPPLCRQQ